MMPDNGRNTRRHIDQVRDHRHYTYTTHKLNILSINVNSIISNKRRYDLQLLLKAINPTICLVQETRLQHRHKTHFDGYHTVRNDQDHLGVAILIKDTIQFKQIPLTTHPNTFITSAVAIKTHNIKILVINIYCPQGIRAVDYSAAIGKLTDTHTQFDHVIIGGDFNARHTDWHDTKSTAYGRFLSAALESNQDFTLLPPSVPTRYSSSAVIDLFLTSNPMLHFSPHITTHDTTFSDHLAVQIHFHLDSHILPSIPPTFLRHDLADWKSIESAATGAFDAIVCRTPIHANLSRLDIDESIGDVTSTLQQLTTNHIPRHKRKNHKFQNLPPTINFLFKHRQFLKRKLQTNFSLFLNKQHSEYIQIKSRIRNLSTLINENLNIHINENLQDRLRLIKPGPVMFKQVNAIAGRKSFNLPPSIQTPTNLLTTEDDMVTALAEAFSAVTTAPVSRGVSPVTDKAVAESISHLSTLSATIHTTFSSENPSDAPLGDYFLQENDTLSFIHRLKNKKTPDSSNVSSFLIRKIAFQIAPILTIIINNCLNLNYFPDPLKISKVIPIPKKKDPSQISTTNDFRPISLVSSLGKIFELAILHKINDHIQSNPVIPPFQFGFRPSLSTLHPLLKVTTFAENSAISRKLTAVCLLDIQKAFDSVWHDGLVHKLLSLKFPVNLVLLLQSFLTHRQFYVSHNLSISPHHHTYAGVPQGSILGPSLFNIYTHDFPTDPTNKTHTLLYADDVIIYTNSIASVQAARNIQAVIPSITHYYDTWRLSVNPTKCEFAIFGSPGVAPHVRHKMHKQSLHIQNTTLPAAPTFKYLGVTFSRNLTFDAHVRTRLNAAKHAAATLSFLMSKKALSLDTKRLLYTQLIRPTLTYAFPIWANISTTTRHKIIKFERHCLRKVTGLWRNIAHPNLHYLPVARVYKKSKIKKSVADYLALMTIKFNEKTRSHSNPLLHTIFTEHSDDQTHSLTQIHQTISFMSDPNAYGLTGQWLNNNNYVAIMRGTPLVPLVPDVSVAPA